MIKELLIQKRELIRSLRRYRKGILNVLLRVASQLKGEIEDLCETGVCEKHLICLDDFIKTEDKNCYLVIKRNLANYLLSILNQINEHNAIKELHDFIECDDWPDLLMYPDFNRLITLLNTYEDASYAEKLILK